MTAGEILALAGAGIVWIVGYGALRRQVQEHEKELDRKVAKDAFHEFREAVMVRLDRIERKLDSLNGRLDRK